MSVSGHKGGGEGTRSLLRRSAASNFLRPDQLEELERLGRIVARRPGTTLYRQDEPATAMYVVLEGSVELRARPPGRRAYRTIEVVEAGCTLGDEAVFGEQQYLTAARVLEQARMLCLAAADYERLVRERPDIATGVARCAGGCLIQTVRRSAILTQAPAEVALELLLKELTEDSANGAPTAVRITHAQLAGLLHLSRETVSRMLSQLAAQGTVQLSRGVIRFRAA